MRALRATMRSALAEAWANRSGFWIQVMTMVVNDLAWVAFWVLFFRRVGSVRGWDTDRVLLLLAVLTTAAGIVLGLLANVRHVGRLVAAGDLDAALALPVSPLAYLLVRRIDTTNLGDMAFGVALFLFACDPTPERAAVYVLGTISAAAVLAGFLIAMGSVSFFTGRNEAGDLSLHAILMFASYPVDVFRGAAKLLLHTAVPAAFVGAVPARLVDDFDPLRAVGLIAVALAFAFAGWAMFSLGLRRYTSSAAWTRA